jgi:hypothetical protein
LDPDLLRSAPSAGDAETAQYWIDEAEKGWGTLHQSPENLYRTIRAYRSAIWYLPEGFSDGTIDAAYLKNRLAESCELLDAQISEAEGRIAANRMIGRRSAVVEEVAVLIKRIPDYRDPRIYPLAGRYYEVREDFPNLTWNPRLFERIEWQ